MLKLLEVRSSGQVWSIASAFANRYLTCRMADTKWNGFPASQTCNIWTSCQMAALRRSDFMPLDFSTRISYNFHLWINDKIESAVRPYNLSSSVGTAKSNAFRYKILDVNRFTSPAEDLVHPQFHETKLSTWALARLQYETRAGVR